MIESDNEDDEEAIEEEVNHDEPNTNMVSLGSIPRRRQSYPPGLIADRSNENQINVNEEQSQ